MEGGEELGRISSGSFTSSGGRTTALASKVNGSLALSPTIPTSASNCLLACWVARLLWLEARSLGFRV
eukprot:5116315-Pyramimonas_sp.AAC.1